MGAPQVERASAKAGHHRLGSFALAIRGQLTGLGEEQRLPGAGNAGADHGDLSRFMHSRPSADTNRIRFKGFGVLAVSAPSGHPSDILK